VTDFCTFLALGVLLSFSSHKYRKTKQNKTKQNKTKQNKKTPLLVNFLSTFGPIGSTETNNV